MSHLLCCTLRYQRSGTKPRQVHISFDDTCRLALADALHSGGLTPEAERLAPLLMREFDKAARFLICDTPNADGGMAQKLVRDWHEAGRLGREGVVVFTGHMTAHARVIAAKGGQFLRWNVHPPLSDQITMIRRLGARRYAPLFCSKPEEYLLEPRFKAALLLNERCLL